MVKKTLQNSPKNYHCEKCDYYASRISDFNKHLQTIKHNGKNGNKNSPPINPYHCGCGKIYKFQSGYCRHKKQCKFVTDDEKSTEESDKTNTDMMEIMLKVVGENESLHKQIQEMIPKIGNNNNSNNQVFNIQLFLNEKCADAMTIQNFAKQLFITMDDLSKEKKECITNVVLKSLQPLAITERPFHCTNLKNQEWYIKDEKEGWKENTGEKVIQNAEYGIQQSWCAEFEKQYPDWMETEALKVQYIAIAGSTTRDLDEKLKLKILKELGKQVKLTKKEMDSL
jgi:hypothetical protein